MATNFRVKIDEIGRIIFICRLGIPKRIEIAISISKGSVWMIWLHRIKIWRIGELRSSNSEFKRGKRCTPLVDQQFGYVRLAAPLLDLAGSVLSFVGRSILSFVSVIRYGRHCYAARATRWALPRISSYNKH